VLVVYGFDARDGRLSVVSATSAPPGWGPRYMLTGPGERTLLVVANEHSGQLTALAVDPDGVAGAPLASVAMPGVSYVEVEAA